MLSNSNTGDFVTCMTINVWCMVFLLLLRSLLNYAPCDLNFKEYFSLIVTALRSSSVLLCWLISFDSVPRC